MFANAIEFDLAPVEGRGLVEDEVANEMVDKDLGGNKGIRIGVDGRKGRVHRQSPDKGFFLCDIYYI